MTTDSRIESSRVPSAGWHCGHYFYRFDRAQLERLQPRQLEVGCRQFKAALAPEGQGAPTRLQTFLISGHRADFGFVALDPDPLVIDRVHQTLLAGPLGGALAPAWSFVSLTESSEYIPTVEQYGQRLAADGLDPKGEEYASKLMAYDRRLDIMRRQRLHPDLPNWPAVCFYPMNKRRNGPDNWFMLDFAQRERLMSQHGASGMQFAGKVTQLVTVALGLDDWEWGVTLWARNPEYLAQIVYRMRFDEVSARYSEFGPFYSGYLSVPGAILRHCGLQTGE